jgi:uncharacterized protein
MRQLLLLALILVLGYLIAQLFLPTRRRRRDAAQPPSKPMVEEMVRDPVCQVYLPRSEAIRRRIGGEEHFFCGPACLDKFLAIRS